MTTIIDESAGITFPNGSNAQAAPSKVLQVFNTTSTAITTTASSSLVTSGISITITPLFSTSKIYIVFNARLQNSVSGGTALAIYRGSTNLTGTTGYTQYGGSTIQTINWLDSPATTSSTTYTIYFSAPLGGTSYIQANGASDFPASLTLMEIAQ